MSATQAAPWGGSSLDRERRRVMKPAVITAAVLAASVLVLRYSVIRAYERAVVARGMQLRD